MAVSPSVSFLLSVTLTVLLFAAMQMYKQQLAATQIMTIFGGWLGSMLFMLIITAVNNFENVIFGRGFQARLFPEVVFALVTALFAAGLVHRVCVTTCFIFSLIGLYYINRLSQSLYQPISAPAYAQGGRSSGKKKN